MLAARPPLLNACVGGPRESEKKNHKYRQRHTHTLPREYPALCGEQIDQVREQKSAVLPSQTVFKRLGGLVNGRWLAWRKTLVCSSFMGKRELGSDRCEKKAQAREGCGAKFSKSKRRGERCSAAKPNGHPTACGLGNARGQDWCKALVCSSFTREREIIAIKVAQVLQTHAY